MTTTTRPAPGSSQQLTPCRFGSSLSVLLLLLALLTPLNFVDARPAVVPSSVSLSIKANHHLQHSILKRDTPATMPQSCVSDFDCLQSTRPSKWPSSHPPLRTGNYACVFATNNPAVTASTGTCQFVVTAGEQCNAAADCAVFVFYSQFNLSAPADLCSPHHCTLESTCGSPWQDKDAPSGHTFNTTAENSISCCGGQPAGSICTLVGSNVDTCQHSNSCNFDLDEESPDPSQHSGYTLDQMKQLGLGSCQPLNRRNHVWIGVVITLISSTVLNLGLNGQKYALRKHDEKRVMKELEMEEEHERWRKELGWTEEQVQEELDRLYELKENRRGKLYRRLKPYMFWRAIFVSKLWAAGLVVFIVGNLGGFIALRFAPQSLTAPLGSISLISNVIIAPLVNKEILGRWDLAGIFFIVAGSVIVVVFSGIVAQDYKLCVLINLFQKPATIAYLSLIAIFMIFTYFFIKFVEKNVENEDDMAIGVSSEQQLQLEQRLYRINSNMSNLSLAQKEQERRTSHQNDRMSSIDEQRITHLHTPERPFGQEQDGLAVNSSISHRTVVSDASGTAVGISSPIGTEHLSKDNNQQQSIYTINSGESNRNSVSSVGDAGISTSKAERRLTFETPRPKVVLSSRPPQKKSVGGSGGDESTGTDMAVATAAGVETKAIVVGDASQEDGQAPGPGVERAQSMTLSVVSKRSNRCRRNRTGQRDSQKGRQGENRQGKEGRLSIWQRVARIELIPSLPEDRLIRRTSPLLRFCLPLSYAALGGMMASYTVLFAKSLINLLVTSIFDGQNQFTSALAWVILVVTVVTAVSQVYWINMGLKKYDALLQVPVFFTIWVLLDIVGGGIYYDEFSGFTATKYVLFCLGVLTVFFGVALLAKRLAVLAKEDVGESQSQSRSPSQPVTRQLSSHPPSSSHQKSNNTSNNTSTLITNQGEKGMPPPRHQTASAVLVSIRRHVHQWVGLVLYNSIYQNILLLHIYRILKFIYGFFSRSTELSRICGASSSSSPSTPLDPLWTPLGHPSSALVNNTHAGTIVYSNPSSNPSNPPASGRRASVQTGLVASSSSSSSSSSTSVPIDPALLAPASATASSTLAARSSTDSTESSLSSSVQSTVASVTETFGEDPSGVHKQQQQQQEVRQRRKRNDSASFSLHTAIMDLRQSKAAAGMIYRIDRCILFSKELTAERRELEAADCDPIQITRQILRKKRFPDSASLSTPAARKLQYALERVASTHQLAREINQRVHTKYDSTNPAHERKLMLLWDLLRPQDKLEGRYTKQWTEIGFQGKDPATDFRGMGMLGLDDLVYYAKYYPMSSRHALECSHDAISWYSFAIVGINITSFAVQTLRTRQLQYYLFLNGTDRSVYHELYCYLFHRFNAYWSTLEPKPSIMDFERVFADFKIMMERQLARRKLMMLRYDTKENMLTGHGHHQPPSSVTVPLRLPQDEANELFELETKKSK